MWKRVTLIGDGADVVTVQAASAGDRVFEVTADYVSISGFAATGATGYYKAGIYLNYTKHCNVSDNNASKNSDGIRLYYSSNNTLTNNIANSNSIDGIYLHYSSNNTLTNNNASKNEGGIYLYSSNNNTLQSNTMKNNAYGICLEYSNNYYNTISNNTFINDGLYISGERNRNTVENNTVNGKPLMYIEDMSNFTIQNAGQVILLNCSNITIENLNFSNTLIGVKLGKSKDCKIVNNTASNSGVGIYLRCSKNNTLQNNTASNNEVGIYLDFWNDNNTLYHNNLINNSQNAYESGGTNQWDSGSEGNYYSDYNGTDPDGDGIGNDPHQIPGGTSTDRFPLMHPGTGDLNSDGTLTPADAAIALQLAATGAHDDAADVSGDGRVTSLDALMILQAAAGRIEL